MGSKRVGYDWATELTDNAYINMCIWSVDSLLSLLLEVTFKHWRSLYHGSVGHHRKQMGLSLLSIFFFYLRHKIVLFHFSIFSAFRLLNVMLTPQWLFLLLDGSTTNPLSRLPTTCSCLFSETTLVWLYFILKLASKFTLNFSLSQMDMPSFQGCSSPSLAYGNSSSFWSNIQN